MSCLRPLTIKNKRYQKMTPLELADYARNVIGLSNCILYRDSKEDYATYKPPDYFIEVPCGKCINCRKSKRQGWSFRLLTEVMLYRESSFVTLTFDDLHLSKFKDNPKKPLMLYIDRLRKYLGYRPRYWFISELGEEKGRLHFHGIFFGTSRDKFSFFVQREKWKYGHVWIGGYCNLKTASYITKYMLKQQGSYKPFIMCSNGIGASYITDRSIDWHLNGFDVRYYTLFMGCRYSLSPYLTRKLFSDDQKVCMMLNRMLDTSNRTYYINGLEFDDYTRYVKYRDSYYDYTLRLGISYPVKFKNNVSIRIS